MTVYNYPEELHLPVEVWLDFRPDLSGKIENIASKYDSRRVVRGAATRALRAWQVREEKATVLSGRAKYVYYEDMNGKIIGVQLKQGRARESFSGPIHHCHELGARPTPRFDWRQGWTSAS